MVQVELPTDQIPNSDRASSLDRKIMKWRSDLPPHFDDKLMLEPWFEIPKRVLIWRSLHLRIILHRPIIFQKITAKADLDPALAPVRACFDGAEECVQSICNFVSLGGATSRGLAWYATYWLITASFVQATCYIYKPVHFLATQWRDHLQRAVHCLSKLGMSHGMVLRARDILKRLLGQSESATFLENSPTTMPHIGQEAALDFWQSNSPRWAPFQYPPTQFSEDTSIREEVMSFPWYAEGSTDAELLDATGAIMLQMDSNSAEPYLDQGSWMPG
ncbi:hypothetical protein M3J09_012932 [Ascochyta lentis]